MGGEHLRYYPINLDIKDKQCLVIGGGKVAERKVETLLSCGARVRVISPELTPYLQGLAGEKRITHTARGYQTGDLNGVFLVVACTDDPGINTAVSSAAQEKNILCNIVDKPNLCNFIVPSMVARGDLLIAISTAGKSPALAKKLRRELEDAYGREYADFLRLMGAVRPRVLAMGRPQSENEAIFNRLVYSDLLDWIRDGDRVRIDRFLQEVLGPEFGLSNLKVELKAER
ncbi:MAG: bifunctional precorrin-2 dehydrogenase/sirohydrochlorin ferrochelatase [Thermodesulfobacteriota bacterium]|nr:bifunctional precorrin-2 dehydrogenase/sirohydrochlorin ferrochelatase [Thermodesulfobacteriota bacterium]